MCGFAVCMSKRVEELARPGTVCIGETTAQLVGARFRTRDRRLVQPRGAQAPVAVHELTAVDEAAATSV
jgi:class 3 adenylate cyclase